MISMPSGVFKPYAGVSTAVLIFTKTGAGGTDKVWFYDMKADGYSLDDKRSPIEDNNIPDILARFHNLQGEADRKPTEQSFLVDKSAIEENGYDLSINRYKEVVYEKVEYDVPEVIMGRLDKLNLDIATKMEELRGLSVSKWDVVRLSEVISLSSGRFLPSSKRVDGIYNVYGGNGVSGNHNEYFIDDPTVVIGRVGEYCGCVHVTEPKVWVTDNALYVTNYLKDIELKYLCYVLQNKNLNRYANKSGQPSISQSSILKQEIPLPHSKPKNKSPKSWTPQQNCLPCANSSLRSWRI